MRNRPPQTAEFFQALLAAVFEFFPEPEGNKARKSETRGQPWEWKDVYSLAAIARVDPGPYSLREISWMANARRMEEWDHTAWLCLHIPRFSRGVKTLADFQPLRRQEKAVAISDLQDFCAEFGDLLPDTLTAEEQDRKFEEWACQQAHQKSERAGHM